MAESTSTPAPALEIEGTIVGLVDLTEHVAWGILQLRPDGETVALRHEYRPHQQAPTPRLPRSTPPVLQPQLRRLSRRIAVSLSRPTWRACHRPNTEGGGRRNQASIDILGRSRARGTRIQNPSSAPAQTGLARYCKGADLNNCTTCTSLALGPRKRSHPSSDYGRLRRCSRKPATGRTTSITFPS